MINIKLIEKRRETLKISKYKMSKSIGKSTQVYYDILKRKSTTQTTLDKIALVLGMNSSDLVI